MWASPCHKTTPRKRIPRCLSAFLVRQISTSRWPGCPGDLWAKLASSDDNLEKIRLGMFGTVVGLQVVSRLRTRTRENDLPLLHLSDRCPARRVFTSVESRRKVPLVLAFRSARTLPSLTVATWSALSTFAFRDFLRHSCVPYVTSEL